MSELKDVIMPRHMLEQAIMAIKYLAEQCDGACARDGAGFSMMDAPLGHALSEKEEWSVGQSLAGLRLTTKYQLQLKNAGFDIEDALAFQKENAVEIDKFQTKRKKDKGVTKGNVYVDGSTIVFKTTYNAMLVEEIKMLVGYANWNLLGQGMARSALL